MSYILEQIQRAEADSKAFFEVLELKSTETFQSKKLPKYIQTDAGVFYPTAFKSVFYSRYKENKVEHKIINHSKTGKYNVRIETVFSKIKDRVNVIKFSHPFHF